MNPLLAQACQNRFVLFDFLTKTPTCQEIQQAHQSLILSGRDDALILTEAAWKENALFVQMRVLGADGSWGEFCGNGARACAAYLFSLYPDIEQLFLTTKKGAHLLTSYGSQTYSVRLGQPTFALSPQFITDPLQFQKEYGFKTVETIEPHLVIEEKLNDQQLLNLGRELNARRDLFPLGINVNAACFLDVNRLFVRTYERGVQRLTASCGTGAAACAAALSQGESLEVITVGGPLELIFHSLEIELKGEAFVEFSLNGK